MTSEPPLPGICGLQKNYSKNDVIPPPEYMKWEKGKGI
jgi:hypothetical protein